MSRSVYVAASSEEIDRATMAMAALRDRGVVVTSTWPDVIASQSGVSNPRDADRLDRMRWSVTDLQQVGAAGILWLLSPSNGTGRGAYAELGFAYGCPLGGEHPRAIVVSGDTKQSIFSALGYEFKTDAEAFEFVVKLATVAL